MEKKILIALIPKSPWARGRIGPPAWQDWVRGCREAAQLVQELPAAQVVVSDAFVEKDECPDLELYRAALLEAGVPIDRMHLIAEGCETIGHLEAIERRSLTEHAHLIVISTFLHYPRVRWLCRGKGYMHRVAWGIPRPKEAFTDLFLMVVFPILDLFGCRRWFLRSVTTRRKDGRL